MKRNTYQRQMVLAAMDELKGTHPSADQVYDLVVASVPTVSKATVYRLLNQIAGEGIVQRVRIPATADRYDDHLGNHYHMRCDQCGRIFDIDMPVLRDIYDALPPSADYRITGHDIVFTGVCAGCAAQ